MVEIAIGLIRLQDWFDGDFRRVIDLVRVADEEGIDVVTMTDHLAYTSGISKYPHGAFDFSPDTPCFEPISCLSAIAVVTENIRLSTGILLAPLRPALLLAKQLATLDMLSHGRVEIGLGAGWQKEEFDAMNIPFEGRFSNLMEQVDAMRQLWRASPASYHGKSVQFDRMHARPLPVAKDIPVLFGMAASERNLERIAQHGDGWVPVDYEPEKLKPAIAQLRQAFVAKGRDSKKLIVRAMALGTSSTALIQKKKEGGLSLDAVARKIPAFVDAGVTQLEFHPTVWIDKPDQFRGFMKELAALKTI